MVVDKIMFYDIKKLNELEKTLSENLMKADGQTWDQSHKPHWVNYKIGRAHV